jgi:hypothetical protein
VLKEIKARGLTVDDEVFKGEKVIQEDRDRAFRDQINHVDSLVGKGPENLTKEQAEELKSQLEKRDYKSLRKNKNLAKLGLDEFFYGRKMNEAELEAELMMLVDIKNRKLLKGLGMLGLLALCASKYIFDVTPDMIKVEG